jgi:hypothetical protein
MSECASAASGVVIWSPAGARQRQGPLAGQSDANWHTNVPTQVDRRDQYRPVTVVRTMCDPHLILDTAPNRKAVSKMVDGLALCGKQTALLVFGLRSIVEESPLERAGDACRKS